MIRKQGVDVQPLWHDPDLRKQIIDLRCNQWIDFLTNDTAYEWPATVWGKNARFSLMPLLRSLELDDEADT